MTGDISIRGRLSKFQCYCISSDDAKHNDCTFVCMVHVSVMAVCVQGTCVCDDCTFVCMVHVSVMAVPLCAWYMCL